MGTQTMFIRGLDEVIARAIKAEAIRRGMTLAQFIRMMYEAWAQTSTPPTIARPEEKAQ